MRNQQFGQKNIYLSRVDSTNNEMFRLLENKFLPEGTVLWTDEQYSGKGLGNNIWDSKNGLNITASFLLYPDFINPEDQIHLNKITSLAVFDTVSEILQSGFVIHIKWPNDIITEGKKIAGILIEHTIQGSMIHNTVVGVGININQTRFDDFLHKATSLKLITGNTYDISSCINKLSFNLEKHYKAFRNIPGYEIDEIYLSRLYKYREKAVYESNGKRFQAYINGVDKYGKLLLKHANGNIKAYDIKEVSLVNM